MPTVQHRPGRSAYFAMDLLVRCAIVPLAITSLLVAVVNALGTLPHSIGGLAVLLVALVLSVFKPRGLTRYGWRRQRAQVSRGPSAP